MKRPQDVSESEGGTQPMSSARPAVGAGPRASGVELRISDVRKVLLADVPLPGAIDAARTVVAVARSATLRTPFVDGEGDRRADALDDEIDALEREMTVVGPAWLPAPQIDLSDNRLVMRAFALRRTMSRVLRTNGIGMPRLTLLERPDDLEAIGELFEDLRTLAQHFRVHARRLERAHRGLEAAFVASAAERGAAELEILGCSQEGHEMRAVRHRARAAWRRVRSCSESLLGMLAEKIPPDSTHGRLLDECARAIGLRSTHAGDSDPIVEVIEEDDDDVLLLDDPAREVLPPTWRAMSPSVTDLACQAVAVAGLARASGAPPRLDESEHRRSTRSGIYTIVDFTSDSYVYAGVTENVSEGGLFVATWIPLPIGSKLRMSVEILGEMFVVEGVVRWWRDPSPDSPPGMGVEWLEMTDALRQAIERLVRERPSLLFET
ncbi:MAG: PilZ domain-containing protein [Deltaproteobacteria bacterium]|nr:PilZ domain-containing protein [Deltaproteobacteria bacterium]